MKLLTARDYKTLDRKERCYSLHVKEKKKIVEISELLGISKMTVSRDIIFYGEYILNKNSSGKLPPQSRKKSHVKPTSPKRSFYQEEFLDNLEYLGGSRNLDDYIRVAEIAKDRGGNLNLEVSNWFETDESWVIKRSDFQCICSKEKLSNFFFIKRIGFYGDEYPTIMLGSQCIKKFQGDHIEFNYKTGKYKKVNKNCALCLKYCIKSRSSKYCNRCEKFYKPNELLTNGQYKGRTFLEIYEKYDNYCTYIINNENLGPAWDPFISFIRNYREIRSNIYGKQKIKGNIGPLTVNRINYLMKNEEWKLDKSYKLIEGKLEISTFSRNREKKYKEKYDEDISKPIIVDSPELTNNSSDSSTEEDLEENSNDEELEPDNSSTEEDSEENSNDEELEPNDSFVDNEAECIKDMLEPNESNVKVPFKQEPSNLENLIRFTLGQNMWDHPKVYGRVDHARINMSMCNDGYEHKLKILRDNQRTCSLFDHIFIGYKMVCACWKGGWALFLVEKENYDTFMSDLGLVEDKLENYRGLGILGSKKKDLYSELDNKFIFVETGDLIGCGTVDGIVLLYELFHDKNLFEQKKKKKIYMNHHYCLL